MSNIFEKTSEMLLEAHEAFPNIEIKACVTGSGGLSLAHLLGLPFEQEVIACSEAVEKIIPETDVAIELGGEDAKITFYGKSLEQRMNGSCAGGTGAFIDQMAILLNTDALGINEYAKDSQVIFPIAARCGVFAKTDIQPLINEGARKEDISASIFQSVVNQTISGLACGRTIKGNIAFLGGPLHFLPELRTRFIKTLELKPEQVLVPEDSQFFVAVGAALLAEQKEELDINDLIHKIQHTEHEQITDTKYIEPLFSSEEEFNTFMKRHEQHKVERKPLEEAKGHCFIGIDAGSTTSKLAVIDEAGKLLYSDYASNSGKPIETTKNMLMKFYEAKPKHLKIGYSAVTGYGEALLLKAFSMDIGEIETMAHYKAAEQFLPGVDFILDIGGQDMKCMRVRDGVIYNIMLNEACSSGCGSFIETYAKSMDVPVAEYAEKGYFAENPVDLGTRCTVFMNSKVKQAQKEGATVGDVSAGLSYSVIKNALYKVIKLRDPKEVGDKVVVQGGTFFNNSVLRSFEKIIGKDVIRPDISGIMGAYGAAILAKEKYEYLLETEYKQAGELDSAIISYEGLKNFTYKVSSSRCKACENNCLLIINEFEPGNRLITGNRCEIGAGIEQTEKSIPNMFEYKYKRLFEYKPLSKEAAPRGEIGIPRVLNMYENYPFWFTFFTELGYRVVISPHSSKSVYEMGMESISSDTACYPAKIIHGHIKSLVNQGVKTIFYPSINKEEKESSDVDNHYNCPVVATYPEVIQRNMNELFDENEVTFINPFLPYDDKKILSTRMYDLLKSYGVSQYDIAKAIKEAEAEDKQFKEDIIREGKRVFKEVKERNLKAIVLAGRPYHIDPEINHSIDKIITANGMAVMTEDAVSTLAPLPGRIRVLDQWTYHSRLYRAANFVGKHPELEMVQLNSFGCGLDAITTDQVEEILEGYNKIYTVIKIDEGTNLGAAKIRIRSLKAAIQEREKRPTKPAEEMKAFKPVEFEKHMKEEGYTILCPQMSPVHFSLIEQAARKEGYNLKVLPSVDKNAIDEGLKHVNNDACFPTIIALGQIIEALKSGEYDLNKTAVIVSQTGGGCRASNYIPLLRKSLKEMHMEQVPVISANYAGLETHEGFKITLSMAKRFLIAGLYGDLLMRVLYAVRPYEMVKGSADALFEEWMVQAGKNVYDGKISTFKKNAKHIVEDFDHLEIYENVEKPKVGVVGEILVKYHPTANNDIVRIIEDEGGEAVVPDLIDFFLYGMHSKEFNYKYLSGKFSTMMLNKIGIYYIEHMRNHIKKPLAKSKRFHAPLKISELADKANKILSLGNQYGEGWLLTGEMVELMDSGVDNIICMQPFACLPNHITGKGMIKALREYNEKSNIVAIDYDPGASEVNQINRIKLMMSTAFKNMKGK